jgi:hypothetical protein
MLEAIRRDRTCAEHKIKQIKFCIARFAERVEIVPWNLPCSAVSDQQLNTIW